MSLNLSFIEQQVVTGSVLNLIIHKEMGHTIEPYFYILAAEHNQLNVMIWMHKHEIPLPDSVDRYASLNGRFEILRWLYRISYPIHSSSMEFAAQIGRIDIIDWMINIGITVTRNVMCLAALCGQIDTLRWLYNKGYKPHTDVMSYAAINGKLDTMKWLHLHHCPIDFNKVLTLAADNNHTSIIQWLLELGYKLPEITNDIIVID